MRVCEHRSDLRSLTAAERQEHGLQGVASGGVTLAI